MIALHAASAGLLPLAFLADFSGQCSNRQGYAMMGVCKLTAAFQSSAIASSGRVPADPAHAGTSTTTTTTGGHANYENSAIMGIKGRSSDSTDSLTGAPRRPIGMQSSTVRPYQSRDLTAPPKPVRPLPLPTC